MSATRGGKRCQTLEGSRQVSRKMCPICLAVGTRGDLDQLLQRLDGLGIAHTAPVTGRRGEAADVPDPDGHIVRIHSLI